VRRDEKIVAGQVGQPIGVNLSLLEKEKLGPYTRGGAGGGEAAKSRQYCAKRV